MVDLSDVTWPKTIISFPVHTAVWYDGAGPVRLRPPTEKWGAALVLMATQQLASGSNRAPVQRAGVGSDSRELVEPPQTIISLPVQMAVCPRRGLGAPSSRVVDTREC